MSVLTKFQSRIAKKEGKKRQISMGDAREVTGIVCDELYMDYYTNGPLMQVLIKNGQRRMKKWTESEKKKHK